MKRNLLMLCGLLCTSCSHPLGIEMFMESGRLVLRFHDCGRWFRKSLAATQVIVSREDAGPSLSNATCYTPFRMATPRSTWQYGDDTVACAPLEPEVPYNVSASRPGHRGSRLFKIAKDRALVPLEPSCK